MNLRRFARAGVLALGLLAVSAAPSGAVVGGHDASPGEYPSVARVTYQAFLCTGTLISPDTVLTAGHCSSITGEATGSPLSWPAPLIDVRIGGNTDTTGEKATVSQVISQPKYLLSNGHDISLLKLSKPVTDLAPTKVSGSGETGLWSAGTTETIAGWGTTKENGDTPTTLQEAQVPITTDAYCGGAYSDFDPQTMICAGFPQGGVDTCQGDSGGPMFGHAADGSLRVVGSTSFGEGCARPGKPGVYARVGDSELREWIRSQDPDGVN
jgi:trypsin